MKKPERKLIKAYRKSRKAEAKELLATFPDVWSQFNRREIRQALAASIAVL